MNQQDTPLARQLGGASSDAVAAVFAQATPGPVAARYVSLSPRARLAAVLAARTSPP